MSDDGQKDLLAAAGGIEGLRKVVETFYEAVFADVMIGFFFRDADKQRLIEKETELAARMLGAKHVEYTGKPIRRAHAAHPIMGGQFDRRLRILEEAMQAHGLPEDVRRAWVEHTQALRAQVTGDAGAECDDEAATERIQKQRMIFNQQSDPEQ